MFESLFSKVPCMVFYGLCGIFKNTYFLITLQNQATLLRKQIAKQHKGDSQTCFHQYFTKHFSELGFHFFSQSPKVTFWTNCTFPLSITLFGLMLEAHYLLYHLSYLSCGTCHGDYVSLIFHKTFHVVHKFSFHSLKYLLQLSFRSCFLHLLWAKSKNLIFSSNVKVFFVSLLADASHGLDIAMLNYVSFQNDIRIAFQFKTKQQIFLQHTAMSSYTI